MYWFIIFSSTRRIYQIHRGFSKSRCSTRIDELIQQLDIPVLSRALQGAELVGIDESKVDIPFAHSSMAFLKSIAFRMYVTANGETDEAAGPILSELRMQFQEGEAFENENQLLGYIRNNFIAYISALTSIVYGRNPFVVLHGPLVRAIGAFSHIVFDYSTARDLFNIDMTDAGEFDVPTGTQAAVSGDEATQNNLPLVPADATDGDKNLRKFNEFCLFSCQRRGESVKILRDKNAVPPPQNKVTKAMMESRNYPGFCLYFWGLRSLADLSRLSETSVASVVENIAAATEMTRIVLPSLIALPQVQQKITKELKTTLGKVKCTFPSSVQQRRDLYKTTAQLIEKLRLSDSNLFSYVLDEGQYTSPVQIYRYQSRGTLPAQRAIPTTETDVGVADNASGREAKAVTSTGVCEPAEEPGSRSVVNPTMVAGGMVGSSPLTPMSKVRSLREMTGLVCCFDRPC